MSADSSLTVMEAACSDWRFIGKWRRVSLGMTCNRTFNINYEQNYTKHDQHVTNNETTWISDGGDHSYTLQEIHKLKKAGGWNV